MQSTRFPCQRIFRVAAVKIKPMERRDQHAKECTLHLSAKSTLFGLSREPSAIASGFRSGMAAHSNCTAFTWLDDFVNRA